MLRWSTRGHSDCVVTTKPFSVFSLQGTRPHLSHCIPFLRPWSSREKGIHYEPKGTFFVNRFSCLSYNRQTGYKTVLQRSCPSPLDLHLSYHTCKPLSRTFFRNFFQSFPVPSHRSAGGTWYRVRGLMSGTLAAVRGDVGRCPCLPPVRAVACNMWLSRYPSGGCPPLKCL